MIEILFIQILILIKIPQYFTSKTLLNPNLWYCKPMSTPSKQEKILTKRKIVKPSNSSRQGTLNFQSSQSTP